MNKTAIQLTNKLLFINKAGFCKMLENRSAYAIKDRVMSTPTWPVPYYQRVHRAYPVRCNNLVIQRKRKSIYTPQILNSMIPTGIMQRNF